MGPVVIPEPLGRLYFDLTTLVADPHRLLTTLTFSGRRNNVAVAG
jgi:predicted ester cyclase